MIGGIDVLLPSRASRQQAIVASLRLIRRFWPTAVVEDAYTSQTIELSRAALLPETANDLFVYPNRETAAKWDQLGAEPELANTMIHLLVRESQVTVVVDDPDAGIIPAIIAGLRSVLGIDSFWMLAKGAA